MTTDILLTLLNVIFGLVLTGIGFEMVNNPPGDVPWKKNAYRGLFLLFGAGVIVTTFFQSVRATQEQERLRTETHHDQMANQAKLGYIQAPQAVASQRSGKVITPDFSPAFSAIMRMAELGAAAATPLPLAASAKPALPPALPAINSPAPESPVILSAPKIFSDGQITGRNFGSDPRDILLLHLRVKPSAQSGDYGSGGRVGPDAILGGLIGSNYMLLSYGGLVKQWSDTAIQLKFPDNYWEGLVQQTERVAKTRNVAPPQRSDLEVCYTLEADAFHLFCPQ